MNNNDILSDLDKKILLGRRLGVFNDSLGQKLLQLYGNGILDPWATGQINIQRDTRGSRALYFLGIMVVTASVGA